jgi:3-oxoacyl-[acyl-carrier protein] reductase
MKNKNILIIGGSSGIGYSLTKNLIPNNNVYTASRSKGDFNGLDVKHIIFDSTKEVLNTSLLPEKLDGFVYCPGSINLRPFKALNPQAFLDDYEINFLGAIKTLQAILHLLRLAEKSSIVFFSTVAVQTGMPFHSSISSSKGAIEGLTRSLAAEFAPNIRVNAIAPSILETPLSNKFLNSDLKKEKASLRHPLRRIGNANEIAKAVVYLLSDDSSWTTGQIMHIDGGMGSIRI